MSVVVTPVTASGSFTYQQVIDDANVKLKNTGGQQWDATQLLSLLNDAVQLAAHAAAILDPEQFASMFDIGLSVASGYGPYSLPDDFKYDMMIENDLTPPKPIDKINRSKSRHASGSGRPQGYWLQGRAPVNAYFDLAPADSYTYKLYYIPVIARQTSDGLTEYVPLEAYFFEPLVTWLVKFAGEMEEYITTTEDQKLAAMMQSLRSIIVQRSNPLVLNVRGCGW